MIDIDALLRPIRDDAPSGPDLRFDAESQVIARVKEHRQSVDPALDPDGKGKEPNWGAVVREAEEALRTQTKDLELIAMLGEGLTWRNGLRGLSQAIELMARALETFWDSIHPGIDEDGISEAIRARWISWLGSSEFQRVVKSAPLNRVDPEEDAGRADRARALSWLDYEGAQMLADQTLSPERRAELVDAGYATLEAWDAGIAATSPEVLQAVAGLLAAIGAQVEKIEKFCEQRFSDPDDLPNLFPLRNLVHELHDYVSGRATPAEEAPMQAPGSEAGAAPAARAAGAGPLQSRQDALQRLREVGDYFRRTEPHSPIAALIARAIRWGNMSFEELVRDLARNEDVIKKIWETLGLDKEAGN